MATLTLEFFEPTPSPAGGYIVKYRVAGSGSAYTTVTPNPRSSPITITGVAAGMSYEGSVQSYCGNGIESSALIFGLSPYTTLETQYGTTEIETCGASPLPIYFSNIYTDIAPGRFVYTDAAMTIGVPDGYIMDQGGILYSVLNGQVGAPTGNAC